ncbi:MAG: hypothetical protein LKJ76_01095 [Lachnospiraceae bacterium]|nr:hypothetical protein [Lachnospiraceae bacterium]
MKKQRCAAYAVTMLSLLLLSCGKDAVTGMGAAAASGDTARTSAASGDAALTKMLQDTYWLMGNDASTNAEENDGPFCDLSLNKDGSGRFRRCSSGRFAVGGDSYWIDISWNVSDGILQVRGSDTEDAYDCTVGPESIAFRDAGEKIYVLHRADMPEKGNSAIPCELAGAWLLTSFSNGDGQEGDMTGISSEIDFYGEMEADFRWEEEEAEQTIDPGLQVEVKENMQLYKGCPNRSWSAELAGSVNSAKYFVTIVGDELQLLKIDTAEKEEDGTYGPMIARYERNAPYGWENSEIGEEDDCDISDGGQNAGLFDFQVFFTDDWAGHYSVVEYGKGNGSSVSFNFSPMENNVPFTIFTIHRYTSDSYRDEMDMIGDNPKELGKHGKYWYVASTPLDYAGGYYSKDENSLYRKMSEFYDVLEDHILFLWD